MNKFLRYSLIVTLLTFLNMSFAHAEDVVFDFDNDYATLFPTLAGTSSSDGNDGDFTAATTSAAVSGATVTVSAANEGVSNANRIWSSAPRLRMYSGTLTINAPQNIKKIVFTLATKNSKFGGGNNTANVGTLTGTDGDTEATWTGDASEVLITIAKNTQISKITLSYDEGSVTPDPTPDPGEVDPSKGATFEATLNKGTQAGSSTGADQVTVNGITISVSPTGSFGNGYQYRVYKGSTFTISTTHGTITKVVMTCTAKGEEKYGPGCFDNVSTGTYTFADEVGTWTGSATEISMEAPTYQVRMTTVEVYINGEQPQAELVISGTTPFIGSTVVTITGGTDVYYTTDGSDPADENNNAAHAYNGPFTITESCTVKAYDDATGLSAEKAFVKTEATEIANIAAFKALADGTEATLKLTDAQVLYVGTNDMYVRDASGAIDFYKAGLSFTAGQKLNGSVTGKYSVYQNLPEFVKTDATNANDIIASAGTAEPKVVSVAAAQADQYLCDLLKIEGATIEDIEEGDYTNTYAIVGNDRIMIYAKKFGVNMSTPEAGKTYDVVGILVPFKGAYELALTQDIVESGTEPGPTPSIKEVSNIAAFAALSVGTKAKLTLTNAEVVYSWTSNNGNNNTFVRDASGAIQFYNCGLGLDTKDLVNGTVVLQYAEYNGEPEATAVNGETNGDELIISKGQAACTPKEIGVDAAASNVNDLVKFVAVTVVSDGNDSPKFYATDASGAQVQLYNGFHDSAYDSFANYADGSTYDVTGILVAYQSKSMNAPIYEIYPIEITQNGSTPPAPQITEVSSIAEFAALAVGTKAKLTLTNAEVLYSWTSNNGNNNTFVRDASGAIQFYNCGLGLDTKDLVNGTVVLQYTEYNGEPEAAAVSGETNADDLIIVKGQAASEPKEVGVAAAASNVNDLVTFTGVTVVADEGTANAASTKYYATDEGGNQVQLYNGFHDSAFDNFETFATGNKYDVTGVIVAYKSKSMTEPIYEIYPLDIVLSETTGISEVSMSRIDVNAPMYNLSGQQVSASFKGVVIQNGKKFILK